MKKRKKSLLLLQIFSECKNYLTSDIEDFVIEKNIGTLFIMILYFLVSLINLRYGSTASGKRTRKISAK